MVNNLFFSPHFTLAHKSILLNWLLVLGRSDFSILLLSCAHSLSSCVCLIEFLRCAKWAREGEMKAFFSVLACDLCWAVNSLTSIANIRNKHLSTGNCVIEARRHIGARENAKHTGKPHKHTIIWMMMITLEHRQTQHSERANPPPKNNTN